MRLKSRKAKLSDNAQLLLTPEDKEFFENKYPDLKKYIVRAEVSKYWSEYERMYAFDFRGASLKDLYKIPELAERLDKIVEYRSKSSYRSPDTVIPHLYKGYTYIKDGFAWAIIQDVSTSKHFVIRESSNALVIFGVAFCESTDRVLFGLLSSRLMWYWLGLIKGLQLGGTCASLASLTFNTFPPPKECSQEALKAIVDASENLIAVRGKYSPTQWMDTYKEGKECFDVLNALDKLDEVVYKAYNFIHDDGSLYDEEEALAGLLELYQDWEAEEE